jgi:hypothetical protein
MTTVAVYRRIELLAVVYSVVVLHLLVLTGPVQLLSIHSFLHPGQQQSHVHSWR